MKVQDLVHVQECLILDDENGEESATTTDGGDIMQVAERSSNVTAAAVYCQVGSNNE